jgi:hypothetical protein
MDQRREPRRPVRYIGWVDVGGGMPPVRCYVENVSDSGANISVYRSAVPDEFTLYFSRQGDAKVRCQVRWRSGSACGVSFNATVSDARACQRSSQEPSPQRETAAA